MNMNKVITGLVRNSLRNVALNTGQRIQKRRQRRGRRQLVPVNIANIPRRRGLGQNGPRNFRGQGAPTPRRAVRTIAANVGNALNNLQISGSVTLSGTEKVTTLGTGSQDTPPAFKVLYSQILNPAEPGLAPMLAAAANQFQRFKTAQLRLTYTSTASAAVNGTLYVCVYPDPNTKDPQTADDMATSGNMKSFAIFGESQSWAIDPVNLQQAFKVQNIKVGKTESDVDNLNVSGRLVVAEVGVPINTTIGQLYWSYAYTCSLSKVTQGANSLHGVYSFTRTSAPPDVIFDSDDLSAGWEVLKPTDTAGVYAVRVSQAPHAIVMKVTATTAAPDIVVRVSDDGETFTDLVNDYQYQTAAFDTVAVCMMPRTRFVQLSASHGGDITDVVVHCASLRN